MDVEFNNVLNAVNRTIGLLRKLEDLISRSTIITINKVFVRPHLDYGDILYDQIAIQPIIVLSMKN